MNEVDDTAKQSQVHGLSDLVQGKQRFVFLSGHGSLGKSSLLSARLLADNLVLFTTNMDALIETATVTATDALVRLDEPIAGHQDLIEDVIDELAREDAPSPEDIPLPEEQSAVAFAESFVRKLGEKGMSGSIVIGQAAFAAGVSLQGEGRVGPAELTPPPQPSPVPAIEADRSTRRINVNFSQSAYETLEQLGGAKGKSMSEVLRDAIQLEKWLTDAKAEGWHVLLEKDGRVRELVRA